MTTTPSQPTYTWDKKYIVYNLPAWVYSEYKQPDSLTECDAKIASLEFTVDDIDMQIQIKELIRDPHELDSREYRKWKAQALKAKQTHMYLLHAYKYWAILCDENKASTTFLWGASTDAKLNQLIEILYEDSPMMLEKIGELRPKKEELG